MTSSFSFGGSAPAAPSLFGGSGTSTTPAPLGFGSPAAPPSSSFGFGTSNAPAPSTFGFGGTSGGFSSTAPAPPPFSFAGPAPATFGGGFGAFGNPSPAPLGSFGFGGMSSSSTPATVPMPPQPPLLLHGSMSYSALSPDMKKVVDDIHTAMMRHKRTMNHLQTMGPRLLQKPENSNVRILQTDLDKLKTKIRKLSNEIATLEKEVNEQRNSATEKLVVQTYKYALWPVEEMGVRKGIPLTKEQEEKKDDEATTQLQSQIRMALEKSMADVDQINRMPSPYFWQIIQEFEQQLVQLTKSVNILQKQIQQSKRIQSVKDIQDIVETQHLEISRLNDFVKTLSETMERLRITYKASETSNDVLEMAKLESWNRERKLQEKVQMAYLQAVGANPSSMTAPTTLPSAPTATAATTGGLFGGNVPAPVMGGGLFGSTFAAPSTAPATTAGGLFGSTTSAATPSSGLFGSTTTTTATASAPAASSSTGLLFGSSTPAPGTTTHDSSFGLTTTTTSNKKKSGSKAGSRLRR